MGFQETGLLQQNVYIELAPVFCDPFPPLPRNLFIPDPFHHPIFNLKSPSVWKDFEASVAGAAL